MGISAARAEAAVLQTGAVPGLTCGECLPGQDFTRYSPGNSGVIAGAGRVWYGTEPGKNGYESLLEHMEGVPDPQRGQGTRHRIAACRR
jgi:hypothetical protein